MLNDYQLEEMRRKLKEADAINVEAVGKTTPFYRSPTIDMDEAFSLLDTIAIYKRALADCARSLYVGILRDGTKDVMLPKEIENECLRAAQQERANVE